MVQDFVGGDAVDPCVESGFAAEGRQCSPYLDEYVLKEVVGIFVAAQKPADMSVESFRVCIHDAVESLFLPAAVVEFSYLTVFHL